MTSAQLDVAVVWNNFNVKHHARVEQNDHQPSVQELLSELTGLVGTLGYFRAAASKWTISCKL